MKKFRIPDENADVRRMIYRRTISSALIGMFLAVFFASLEWHAIKRYWNEPRSIINATVLYLLICSAPVFIFKLHKRLFDFSFEGSIEKIEISERVWSEQWFKPFYNSLRRHTVALLTIRTDKGKKRKWQYILDRGDLPFQVGSRVRHYRGTDHLLCLDTEAPLLCVCCGSRCDKNEDFCPFCRKSLITPPKSTHSDDWYGMNGWDI